MTAYEEACRKECQWCAKDYVIGFMHHHWWVTVEFSHAEDSLSGVTCTAPTPESFMERQAAEIKALKSSRANEREQYENLPEQRGRERDDWKAKYEQRESVVMDAMFAAYQFCAARGANTKLLDNLSAFLNDSPLPHAEWPTETGTWNWAQCGHAAGTACAQCLDSLAAQLAEARNALKTLDSRGGLGIEVHEWLASVIAKLEGR